LKVPYEQKCPLQLTPRLNYRRVTAAAVAAWLVSIPLGTIIHHGVLGDVYAADAAAFRPDVDVVRRLPIGYAAGYWDFSSWR
jgi:hypothetical protein